MPPYRPVVSDAQRRLLFAKARRGELSMADARGKARAAKGGGPRGSPRGRSQKRARHRQRVARRRH